MKIVVLACMASVAVAAPRPQEGVIEILRDERHDAGDGNFNYSFETANGIVVSAVGTPGAEGQSNIEGVFSFPLPNGVNAEVRYVANEDGFQPESDLLPTLHRLPELAVKKVPIAGRRRSGGIVFE